MAGNNKKHGVNPIVAGVTGAVVGGIAVAGALTLADEKKREQVKDALVGAKDKATGFVQEAKEKAMDKAGDIQDAFHHATEDLQDAV